MPTVNALNNLNIRVHVHTQGKMPKQLPFAWIRLHAHTHAPTDTEHLNYCNAIRMWHPPLHTCFQGPPPLPATLPRTCQQSKSRNFWKASHLCYFAKVNSQPSLSLWTIHRLVFSTLLELSSSQIVTTEIPTAAFWFARGRFLRCNTSLDPTGVWCKHWMENSF